MSFLLRVQLPDRPGSLGSLALALGAVGADILSLDVVERGTGYAVDDLVVDVRSGSLPDTLITAAEALDGVRVDSIRPFAGMLDTHRERAHRPGGDRTDDRLKVLVDGAPRVLRVGWSTVVGTGQHGAYRLVGSPGAPRPRPVSCRGCRREAGRARRRGRLVPQIWRDMGTKLAAHTARAHRQRAAARPPGGPEFRPSEVARLATSPASSRRCWV